jgi:hypothetical protein
MRVGINYPWFNYGWDFGQPVPDWGPRAAWRDVISDDLKTFQRCGVTIVRWFVLGDGITYGMGRTAPHRDGEQWRFDRIPALDPTVWEKDFSDLLELFAHAKIQLLPVLMDYRWAFPGLDRETRDTETLALWRTNRERARRLPEGYVKGGRADVIYDERKSAQFFRRVLGPFLEISRDHVGAIYAWELINEPDWVTRQHGLGGRMAYEQRIPLERMLRFIRRGLAIIGDYGFRPTVGFAKRLTFGDWSWRRATAPPLARTWLNPAHRQLGLGVNQIHYYPHDASDRLVPASFHGIPCVLGEFATRLRGVNARHWPDLGVDHQNIAWRLRWARAQGYDAALPWSYRARDYKTVPDHRVIEAELRAFAAK